MAYLRIFSNVGVGARLTFAS